MHWIAHVDADSFYVSCERIRDSTLVGKPVGVLGNQGACVIARSYEMKPYGVTVGMPIWEAKKRCPRGIYVKRDFEWYGIISHQIQDFLKEYTDKVEFYSVDESFMDLGEMSGDLYALGREIQKRILKEIRVPVTVGIAQTRILAKLASDNFKPFGVTVLGPENLQAILQKIPVSEVHGIGSRLTERLLRTGITTALDFVNTPRRQIRSLLNKPGEELWYELQGKSLLPIKSVLPQQKTISRGGSIWGHHKDPRFIFGFLVRNLERLTAALWLGDIEILHLTVVLVASSGQGFAHTQILPDFTSDYGILLKAIKNAFRILYQRSVSICAVHLVGEPIRSRHKKQLSLFDRADEKAERLKKVRQTLLERFGPFTVRSAVTAYVPEVFRDKNSDFEICDIEGKVCF